LISNHLNDLSTDFQFCSTVFLLFPLLCGTFNFFTSTWSTTPFYSFLKKFRLKRGSKLLSIHVQTHPVATRSCTRYRLDTEEIVSIYTTSRRPLVNVCSTFRLIKQHHLKRHLWNSYYRLLSISPGIINFRIFSSTENFFGGTFTIFIVSTLPCVILRLLKHDLSELELKLNLVLEEE